MNDLAERLDILAGRLMATTNLHQYAQLVLEAAAALRSPEGDAPSGYAVMNSEGKLHSLTLFLEVAEHNAKTLNQMVVPLYRHSSLKPQGGST